MFYKFEAIFIHWNCLIYQLFFILISISEATKEEWKLASFVENTRGGAKLDYQGFKFVVNRPLKSCVCWQCSGYKKFKCMARAVTKEFDGIVYVKLTNSNHTHGPFD